MLYTLSLYQPVLIGSHRIADITDLALDWRRSIRMQGGYWMGSFTIVDKPSVCEDFFHTCLGCHVAEHINGPDPSWEGMVAEMAYDPVLDIDGNASVDVDVIGYVHTCQWRYCTVSGGDGYASAYVEAAVDTDCEFLQKGRIDENTVSVKFSAKLDQRVWDAILGVIDIGDADGNPWRFYVGNDRKAHYILIDTAPKYFIHGGIRRRRSLLNMGNAIIGKYEDDDGVDEMGTITNDESISRYGRREEDLIISNIDEASATIMQTLQLAEYAWPWPRAENVDTAELFESESAIVPINPYLVAPGVVRDISYPVGGQEHGSWLDDLRDFFIDEVEVSLDGLRLLGWEYGLDAFIPGEVLEIRSGRMSRLRAKAARWGINLKAGHGTPSTGAWASQSNMNQWRELRKQRKYGG
ncbi:MAG: hypothetical protein JW908_00520 [Anaerolineales bacterium]|nr:hypothetical protein [Anaerolineales bacterium]